MPPPNSSPGSAAILAILLESKQAGVGKITRTALMKYLYLLDLYMAEETQGNTWTGAAWRFHHFGPYAQALADDIDLLAGKSLIQEITGGGGSSKDYTLYSIGEWSTAKSLEALGFPRDARMRLGEAIREFAQNLSGLLDMVYFRTEPMRGVRPGQDLSFASARKVDFKADIKPVQIPVTDSARAANIQALAKKIGENYLRASQRLPDQYVRPIRDEHYAQAIAGNEDDRIEGEYSAELTFGGR